MKNTICKIVLALLTLAAYGAAPVPAGADGVPAPACWPNPCQPQ
ncbi:MAG TPA: hypothetical protein VNW97_03440 [Candidatus Saccharimonadales bacterium]|jgi:hypothetical protein|nr:hypothetical protein [Candidatus Saccharimonadales bacterium]